MRRVVPPAVVVAAGGASTLFSRPGDGCCRRSDLQDGVSKRWVPGHTSTSTMARSPGLACGRGTEIRRSPPGEAGACNVPRLARMLPWQGVIVSTSLGAVISAAIAILFVRSGPFEAPSARLDLTWAMRSLRAPAIRLANLGYFGHMWELYAMWTWKVTSRCRSPSVPTNVANPLSGLEISLARCERQLEKGVCQPQADLRVVQPDAENLAIEQHVERCWC
jgi:hypothetical protein